MTTDMFLSSVPSASLIILFLTFATRWVPLVGQQLLTLPEPCFCRFRVAQYLVFLCGVLGIIARFFAPFILAIVICASTYGF